MNENKNAHKDIATTPRPQMAASGRLDFISFRIAQKSYTIYKMSPRTTARIMAPQAVNDWGAVLSAMNVSSGGNAIQVSNLPQRGDGMRGMKQIIQEAMSEMPAPVVSVVDINKGQKRVKVSSNLAKLGRIKYK